MKDNPANRAFQRNLYEQTEDFKSKMERKKKNRKSMDKARQVYFLIPQLLELRSANNY